MLNEDLNKLGLTNGEARVYLSLLKLSSAKVGAIMRDSTISHSKAYDVLQITLIHKKKRRRIGYSKG